MRKIFVVAFALAVLSMCGYAWADVNITAENFPDNKFRNYISNNFDTDEDGTLSDEEIEAVTALPVGLTYSYISNSLIMSDTNQLSTVHDFTGIEHFAYLEALYYEELFRRADPNLLAGIDLSHNTRLVFLHFVAATVSQLDLSSNSALLYADLPYGELASVDVSGCTNLHYLNVSNNLLDTLDVSDNPALEHLDFSNNRIQNISLAANTNLMSLNCASNDLAALDLGRNSVLTFLDTSNNHLPRLDLSNNVDLLTADCVSQSITGGAVMSIPPQDGYSYQFNFSSILPAEDFARINDVRAYDSTNSEISINYVLGGGITFLAAAPDKLTYIYDTQRSSMDVTITSIDITESTIQITTTSITSGTVDTFYTQTITADGTTPISWDIQGLPEALSCDKTNTGSSVIISGIPQIGGSFDITITAANASGSDTKHLTLLISVPFDYEHFGGIVSIDIDIDSDDNDVLDPEELDEITSLPPGIGEGYPPSLPDTGIRCPVRGLRHFRNMKRLYISCNWNSNWPGGGGSGGGTEIDVSGNPDLEILIIRNVHLRRINLSKNTKLRILILVNCGLTELDLTSNTQLEYLDCSYNYLRVLDLTVNVYLKYLYCHHNYLRYIIPYDNTSFTESGCHSQDVTGELKDNTDTTNPYRFDLRELVPADKLVYIDISSIRAYDESGSTVTFTIQDYVLYFPKVVKLVIYYYRILDIHMEVRVTLTYNGTGEQPPQTALSIITTRVSTGTVSISYNFTFTASGTGSLTWSVIGGSLPPGLKLTSGGTLTGTPTQAGDFSFRVQVRSSSGQTAAEKFMLTIRLNTSVTRPVITTTSLTGGTVSVSYSEQLTATGSTPITWRIVGGALPAGLSLTNSGAITGTPTTAGTFTFTVIAENSAGSDRKELSITIRTDSGNTGIKPDIIATYTLKNATVGVWYSVSLYAEGTRAISWRITEGSLPAGLTLNTSDGTITGTPRGTGQYTFTVEALNSWGTDIAIFVINVYTASGNGGGTTTTITNIVYEYTRTIYSLTEYELSMLPGSLYIIAAVLPRFRVVTAGTYQFTVSIYDTVPAGLTLVWFPFALSGSGGENAIFLNTSRQEITLSPDNRRLIVSVYLEAGTYAPVIAVLRPSEEEESPDVEPAADGGGGGGGCSYGMGSLMLLVVAGLAFFRKR